MSFTNTTTHYQWPLPVETDLFNGLDDNQMKEDLDEKIYNLEQRSTGDHEAVTQLNARVTEVEQTVGGYDAQIEQLEGTVGEHAERLVNLTNRQTELSRRLNGKAGESTIAPEYNEEESYSVGDFVYHNNILYKATSASATPAGDFDAANWDIVILTDELGGSAPIPGTIAAANVSFDDTVAHLGVDDAQEAIDKLSADLTLKANSTITLAETKIGKLGSDDLYRRVIKATGQAITTTTTIDNTLTLNNIKALYRIDGSIKTADAGFMPVTTGVANTFATVRSTGVQITYAGGFGNISDYCIVLEYTKN